MNEFKLKDYKLADTIAAIATFPSKSALGIIKISGEKAISAVSKIFKPAKQKDIKKAKTFTIHYGWITEKSKGKSQKSKRGKESIIDEVLVSIMRAPNSYTREDVVEISSHGGTVVLNKILDGLTNQGIRLALPGEFTYRALVSGRIDLLQAESISSIVEAKTENALGIASSQLAGKMSLHLKDLRGRLKDLFVQTESLINFPEDLEFSPLNLKGKIERIDKEIDNLIEGSSEGKILQEGLKCVICGKSNAGKSTLFNLLLGQERVIVSRIPGTTRDVIEETINIRGVPLRIYDTAGILEPKDLVTKKALEKTKNIFDEADLVIFVLDASRKFDKDDSFLFDKVKNKNTIFVINKCDLDNKIDLEKLAKVKGAKVKMSALQNTGLGKLERAVYDNVYSSSLDRQDLVFLSKCQSQFLGRVKINIQKIKEYLKDGQTLDFINFELKDALENLGKLSGEILSEEVLENIFSQFCIGK